MSERIIIDIDDSILAEYEARLDEALAKQERLIAGGVPELGEPRGRRERRPSAVEGVGVIETSLEVFEAEAELIIQQIDDNIAEALARLSQVSLDAEWKIEELDVNLSEILEESDYAALETKTEIEELEEMLQVYLMRLSHETLDAEARIGGLDVTLDLTELDLERVFEESEAVFDFAKFVEENVDATVQRLVAELMMTESYLTRLKTAVIAYDIPGINRATRLILTRLPIMREAMQLLYRIRMEQRLLKQEEYPTYYQFLSLATMVIYLSQMILQVERWMKQQQETERRMELERDIRFGMIENVLAESKRSSEQYRMLIPP